MSRSNFPFIGPAYTSRSLNVSAQRAVNCFLEAGFEGAPIALYGTPGTVKRATLGAGPVRGAISTGNYAWFVSGNTVYRLDSNYATTVCGTMKTSSGRVAMSANSTQILIVDGVAGYIVTISTSTSQVIDDPDFPNGVTNAGFQDGFFTVSGDGTGQFYINESPGDGLVWNGTDFASAEGDPDNVTAHIHNHREMWIGGSQTFEVWINTGNASFPFERSSSAFIEQGICAPASLSKLDNTVFWLSSNTAGAGIVYRANGYTPSRISTHAIEYAISKYPRIDDAIGFTYQQEGHAFYILTFPSGNATWVFDAATSEWHERAWFKESDGSLNRWRPMCHVFAFGKHLCGDWENGNVYSLEMDVYTDDNGPIKRIRTTLNQNNKQLRQFFAMLQLQMETGVGDTVTLNPKLTLRISDDAGHTWGNERVASMGKAGEYAGRVRFHRCGSGYNRAWEISTTDPVKFAVINASLEVENGR